MEKEVLKIKMIAAAGEVPPTDYCGQIASMMGVLANELKNNIIKVKANEASGQVYYRPYQIAKRWGYSENGLRQYLCEAEQSGKVRIIQPHDKFGSGQKLYHIGDLEQLFGKH